MKIVHQRSYLFFIIAISFSVLAYPVYVQCNNLAEIDFFSPNPAFEILDQEDTRPFFVLRQQVQNHPLVAKRNEMLRLAKPYLAEVADEISFPLGVDYAALAKPV